MEASDETEVHIQSCTLTGNKLTGRGGAIRAERVAAVGASFKLSIHDCRITGNKVSRLQRF
jgi:hypothetical protein